MMNMSCQTAIELHDMILSYGVKRLGPRINKQSCHNNTQDMLHN